MSKRTTKQDVLYWLEENASHIELISWGGAGSKRSTFFNKNTGYEFSDTFIRVRSRINNGMNVGARRAKSGNSKRTELVIREYLDENAPHIELIKCSDKISDKSLFYNTIAEKEFWFSFSDLKYQLRQGYDVGIGLDDAARRLNAARQVSEQVAIDWLKENCPHIQIIDWSGTWSGLSKFYSSELDQEFSASLKNIKVTVDRGGIPFIQRSSLEVNIENWFKNLAVSFQHNKQLKNCKYRPDFVLPDHNLIIECDGLYWHSDANIEDKNYHINKLDTYNNLGYKAFFFRSDELLNKEAIVKSMILNVLQCNERVYARDCDVIVGNNAFFEEYHLMGSGTGEIVSLRDTQGRTVASIQTRWVDKDKGLLDVSRFCSAPNVTVVGGFSKLLSVVEKNREPNTIQTFIDRRYGSGYYLNDLGFTQYSCYPSFKWTDGVSTFHRMRYPGNSGYDYDFFKIWDCGQAKWIKECGDTIYD